MGLKDEGIRACGIWEPIAHVIRSGRRGGAYRWQDAFDWYRTDEFVRGLKDRGYNLVITQFVKGYGIEAEATVRDGTMRMAELCHKHDMYVGGYVRYSTIIPETMKQEVPDCVARFSGPTIYNTPARYGASYWRFMPCPSSTEFLEYLDRLISIGVEEIGLDMLHVDGVALRLEPFTCRCQRCQDGFRHWLNERYPSREQQLERFGFTGFDHVELPDRRFTPEMTQWVTAHLFEPMEQEWVFFQCHLLEKIWRFIVEAGHRRNPDCFMQCNTTFAPELNAARFSGVELNRLMDCGGDGFFTEEVNAPNLTDDGRLAGYFQTFKLLRALGQYTFTYNRAPITHGPCKDRDSLRRAMAHQMAFNTDSAGVASEFPAPGAWPVTDTAYMAFHRDRRDLYADTRPVHDVAVYYSDRTRTINAGTPIATANMLNDSMMRAHVPFGVMLAEKRDVVGEYRAVVMPEVECLTASEANDLAQYVRGGGGLVVIGANTGRYDELGLPHRDNVLAAALDLDWRDDSPVFTTRVGQGRVAYLPMLVAPEGAPADLVHAAQAGSSPYFQLVPTDWHPPQNAADLVKLLAWAADGFRFGLTAADTTVVEYVYQPTRSRYLIHLVNFDLTQTVGAFEIRCHGIGDVCGADACTPDDHHPTVDRLETAEKQGVIVRVSGFERYAVVSVTLSRG